MSLFDWLSSPSVQNPTGEQQPGFLELLSKVASGFYGGFQPGPGGPQYGSAAGALGAFGDYMQGRREASMRANQAKAIGGQFPDLQPFLNAGVGISDAATLADFQQKHAEEARKQHDLEELAKKYSTGSLVGPPTAAQAAQGITGIGPPPPISPGDFIRLTGEGLKLPKEMLAGGAGGAGLPKSLWQGITQLHDPSDVRGMVDEYGRVITGQKAAEAGAATEARNKAAGASKGMGKPLQEVLTSWGTDPTTVKPGDPIIGEAREAVGMERAAATLNKQHQQIIDSGQKSMELLPSLRASYQQVVANNHSPVAMQFWAKLYDARQKPDTHQGFLDNATRFIGVYGDIPPDVDAYLNLVGQFRVTSQQAYAASLASRAVSAQVAAQSHVPTGYTGLKDVPGQLDRAERLLRMSMTNASLSTNRREKLIATLRQAHPEYNYARAAYLIDRYKLKMQPEYGNAAPAGEAPQEGGEEGAAE